MLNAGKYIGRASELAWQESRNGNTYTVLRFTVTQGEHANQTCTKALHWSDAALERTVADLRTCGWQGTNPADLTAEDLPNEVSITVEHEQYADPNTGEQKTSARVKWINALGQPLKSTADAAKVQGFGKAIASRIAALDAKARASGAAPRPPTPTPKPAAPKGPPRGFAQAPAEEDDSEIPF